MRKKEEIIALPPLRHTQYAFYLITTFAISCIFYDSASTILLRYHINKKWFYLYGAMCLFAYAYVRPLIRRRLGSASGGYINWSTVYAVWLCAAVFYHLPSLDSLGVDVKADLSMLITVFLGSLAILGAINATYGVAVIFHWLSPRLLDRNSGVRDAFTTVILNSLNLAMACSSYYSLCGNAPTPVLSVGSSGGNFANSSIGGVDIARAAVCGRWLHPLSAGKHPSFSAYVIYGETMSNESADASSAAALKEDSRVISPVFTTWLTLFAMLLVNSVAGYLSRGVLNAAYSVEARREILATSSKRRSTSSARRHRRRHSAEFPSSERPRSVEDYHTRSNSRAGSLEFALKTVSSLGSIWSFKQSPTALEGVGFLFRDDFGVGLQATPAIGGVDDATPVPGSLFSDPDVAAGVGLVVPPEAPAPSFLPMFPWYSGTSADLLKTLFDLVVSVKVFLGRFDQRTMQAATANVSGGGGSAAASGAAAAPHDGDGFTFEHLSNQDEVWLDFAADTGDGGDSTFSVARCLAAPRITVELPKEIATAAGAPPPLSSVRVLPRASCLVHGGDLAYPNPTDETYEQRLFGPYEDALPPPAHIHPGNLVVNKPDLPKEYWVEGEEMKKNDGRSGGGKIVQCGGCQQVNEGGNEGQLCYTCRKAAALEAYDGPSAFLIPGNHDWVDGLETFTRHIVHKGWLGGWLLPQEKSYFALKLPCGWWLFAMDLGLIEDLDFNQYRYFARIAEERMAPTDAAIIVSHAPYWLINWFWGRHEGKNLRQLIRGPLRGRARLHLCGDLHFYMRHSFKPYKRPGSGLNGETAEDNAEGISLPLSELSTPAGGSPIFGGSPRSSKCPTPTPPAPFFAAANGTTTATPSTPPPAKVLHQSLLNKLKAVRSPSPVRSSPLGSSPDLGRSNTLRIPTTTHDTTTAPVNTTSRRTRLTGVSSDEELFTSSLGASPPAHSEPLFTSSPLPPLPPSHNPTAAATAAGALMDSSSSSLPQSWWPNLPNVKTASPPANQGYLPTNGSSPKLPPLGASPPPALPGAGFEDRFGTISAANAHIRRSALSVSGLSIDFEWESPPPGYTLNDPEHLVVCGGGGAFLHPTHVFSYARFRPPHDPAAGPIYLKTSSLLSPPQSMTDFRGGKGDQVEDEHNQQQQQPLKRSFPSDSSLYSLPRSSSIPAFPPNPKSVAASQLAQRHRPAGGEYRCQAAYPSPEQSLKLGRLNLHTFRHVNSRFDVIGGAFYYLLVVSVLPRCSGIAAILDAHSVMEGAKLFAEAGLNTVAEIFGRSYVSLAAVGVLFLVVFGFAKTGGVGAISGIPPAQRRKPEYRGFALAVRARLGGLPVQLAYAAAHAFAHLSAAITLVLLLELGVEMVMRYEGVGKEGYHSLYRWYQSFESLHFPDPAGVRNTLSTITLGLYPNIIKWAFALFDVPEVIAVSRTSMCAAGGTVATLTRLQTLGYYVGVLLYFWVLATPVVGLIFGLYLYVSGNWLHVHYDESFSALQVAHHKGFLRLHVTRGGDLEVFALGLEESPYSWREDPRWRGPGGGGAPGAGHKARWPSRWIPVTEQWRGGGKRKVVKTAPPPEAQLKVVDYLYVPKQAMTT